MTARWLRNAVTLLALLSGLLLSGAGSAVAHAQGSNHFDLTGPTIDLRVMRGTASLPIGSVPNLQAGDVLWVHPDLPQSQSVHYILVVVFLRGTTNPPPDKWFIRLETWDKTVRDEGTKVTVPEDAQQVVLLLAPDTGGGFQTLRSAVQGRPGIFVRASQDLNEAGFEQARIDQYLALIQKVPPGDSKALQDHSALLARTLALKPNDDCFKKSVDQQLSCLSQSGNQTLLDDGHGQTIVAALSNGPGSDLINQASYTQMAGAGLYSAYVGAVVDLVRLMSNLHTAHYQYIPAIASEDHESMHLKLNTPPSFNDPKSVIVIGLPAVQKATPPPPLRAANPNDVACLLKPGLSLGVEGAPLVFSTSFAHDLVLHLSIRGKDVDLPLQPDAYQGGLTIAEEPQRRVLSSESTDNAATPGEVATKIASTGGAPDPYTTGVVRGRWGFDEFVGPELKLQDRPGDGWAFVHTSTDGSSPATLIAGQKNQVTLSSTGTACVQTMDVSFPGGDAKAVFKPQDKPKTLAVELPLEHSNTAGSLDLAIHQYGTTSVAKLTTQTFIEAAKISAVELHADDRAATMTGSNLGQVESMEIAGTVFRPDTAMSSDRISLHSDESAAPAKVQPGEQTTAQVKLHDGRVLPLNTTIAPPRPQLTLLNKRSDGQGPGPALTISNPDDLAATSLIHFVLKSATPFPRRATIEIAAPDDSLSTTLTLAPGGGLVLQDAKTVLGTLDPQKAFGPSSFGPLRLRAVTGSTASDWMPFATLVRLPVLNDLRCPPDVTLPCSIEGSGLFVLEAVARDQDFTDPVRIPDGLTATSIDVPRLPGSQTVYLKLRDDPNATVSVVLPPPPRTPGDTDAPPKKSHHAAGQAAPVPPSPTPQTGPVQPAASPAATAPPSLLRDSRSG